MPFKSQAQRRFMYANYPKIAKRWSNHTPKNVKLPEHVKESLNECYNYKNIIMTDDKTEASVFFTLTNAPGAELGLIFNLVPDADYAYGVLKSKEGKIEKFEDPLAAKQILQRYGLTPDNVENMGQEAYEEIEKHQVSSKMDDGVREESLQFEDLFDKIVNS